MAEKITEQIRERAILSEVIGERVALTQRGRTIKGLCPFHNDTNPSLHVSDEKGLFKCFSCGMGGDVFKFVMEYEKVPFKVAAEKLAKKYGLSLPSNFSSASGGERHVDPYLEVKGLNRFAANVYHKYLLEHRQAAQARQYLAKRGIKAKAIKQFKLGYAPKNFNIIAKLLKRKAFQGSFKEQTILASNLFQIPSSYEHPQPAQEKSQSAQEKSQSAQGNSELSQQKPQLLQGQSQPAQEKSQSAQGNSELSQQKPQLLQGQSQPAQEKSQSAQGNPELSQQKPQLLQGNSQPVQENSQSLQGNTGENSEISSATSHSAAWKRDFFNHRIMFPIYNEQQDVLGFGGRALDDHPAKYMNSRESEWFLKHKILYGISEGYQLMIKHKEVFIVEGYFDVLAMQAARLPAVAPLGTAVTIDQLQKLKRYVKRVHFLFDGDTAGVKAALHASALAVALEMDGAVYTLPENEDPFDFIMAKRGDLTALQAYFNHYHTNIYDYLITRGRDISRVEALSPVEKKDELERLMPVYVAISNATIKNAFKTKIQAAFQTDPETILEGKRFHSILKTYAARPSLQASSLKATQSGTPMGRVGSGGTAASHSVQGVYSAEGSGEHDSRVVSGTMSPKDHKARANFEATLMHSRKLIEDALVLFLAKTPSFLSHAATLLYVSDFEDDRARTIYKKILHLKNDPNPLPMHVLDLFKDQNILDYLLTHLMEEKTDDEAEDADSSDKTVDRKALERHFEELYCRFKIIQFRDREIELHLKAEVLAQENDEEGLRSNQETLLRASAEKRTLQEYLSRQQGFNLSTTAYYSK